MAIDRRTYKRQVGGIGVPSVQFPQFRQQAEMFSELNKRIDVIKDFAIQQGTEKAVERGQKFAINNPINLADFLNGDPVTNERLLSTGPTAFDKAVDATRINLLTSDLEANALAQMNEIAAFAEANIGTDADIGYLGLQANLEGIIDGTSELLNSDPEAATAIYSSLTTKGSAIYKSYLDKLSDNALQELKSVNLFNAELVTESIPNYIGQDVRVDLGPLYDFESPEDEVFRWEDQLDLLRQQQVNKLISAGVEEGKILTYTQKWEEKIQSSIKQALFIDYVDNPELDNKDMTPIQNANERVKDFSVGKFDNPMQQRLYDRYFDKEGFLTEVETWRDNQVNRFLNQETESQRIATEKIADLDARAFTALQTQNFDEVNKITAEYETLAISDPALYGEASKSHAKLVGPFIPANNSSQITYTDIRRGVIDMVFGPDDIRGFAGDGIIPSGDVAGGKSAEFELVDLAKKLRNETFIKAQNIMRLELGLNLLDANGNLRSGTDLRLDNIMGVGEKAKAKLTLAMKEFLTYEATNPDATGKELLNIAQTLVKDADADLQILADIDSKFTKLNQVGNGIFEMNDRLNSFFRGRLGSYNFTTKEGYDNLSGYLVRNRDTLYDDIIVPLTLYYNGTMPKKDAKKLNMGRFEPGSDEMFEILGLLTEINNLSKGLIDAQ